MDLEVRKEVSVNGLVGIQIWDEQLTHPVIGSKAPAMTAPKDTPIVKPVFTNPMNNPLFFFPENSRTKMNEIVIIPAPPIPLIALPNKKVVKVLACDVITPPIENRTEATMMQFLGEKTSDNRAASGDIEDIAMRYVEVNQLALAKASKSAAIFDCVVVMILMFAAESSSSVFRT